MLGNSLESSDSRTPGNNGPRSIFLPRNKKKERVAYKHRACPPQGGEMNNDAAFAMIRDAVDDPVFFQRLATDLDEVLTERGLAEPVRREEVKRVMAALVRSRAEGWE